MTSLYKVYGVNSALMHSLIVLSIEVETIMTEFEIDKVRSGHRLTYYVLNETRSESFLPKWCLQQLRGCRITTFEPCPSIGLACSLEEIKRGTNYAHVPSTCNVHPGQISIQRRDAPVQMCQCAMFGVAISKIQKLRGSND